jgi:hypothetical protein
MKRIDEEEHKLLAFWAADCAELVLSSFEKNHAKYAASYAVKASINKNGELKRQIRCLPEKLKALLDLDDQN